MDNLIFGRLRRVLGKSQKALSEMLGISLKAVQSYEQGWRNIPPAVERMLYYIAFKLECRRLKDLSPCWKVRSCPKEIKKECTAWKIRDGFYCWFITGRLCSARKYSGRPDADCYECPVFQYLYRKIITNKEETECR